MTPETAKQFAELEAQAHALTRYFIDVGYELVAPAIIQPAEVFLNAVGEDLRRRTYVFTDPEGSELCLRPDLTVPTCRLHWQRCKADGAGLLAKYCYNGPAFRFQPAGSPSAHPREFRQLGIEAFGDKDKEQAEINVLGLVISAIKRAGVQDYRVRIGDLGIFHNLLDALDLPVRWRERLRAQFWQPDAFRSELRQMTTRPDARIAGIPKELITSLQGCDGPAAEHELLKYLDANEVPVLGARSVSEIASNLLAAMEDALSDALPEETAGIIERYLEVVAPARAAGARLGDLMSQNDVNIDAALKTYQRRLKFLSEVDIDPSRVEFAAEFGRSLEYYSGFVFEVFVEDIGAASPIAGGGRYDGLMRLAGATTDVPAVGAMIHTERLLAAVSETGRDG
ncbi:MAG: ATP phosphoribosyltransferase regulatory subunit [Pseudomonadota bacterium]